MKRDDVFPSKFLKASDLNGKPLTVTIEAAPYETLTTPDGKEENKVVLYFKGMKKCFPLNITNFDSVADITGEEDSDKFPGHRVELYPTTTELRGKVKDCVRVRAPAQPELKVAAAGKSAKKTTAAAKPTPQDDLDDAIPF